MAQKSRDARQHVNHRVSGGFGGLQYGVFGELGRTWKEAVVPCSSGSVLSGIFLELLTEATGKLAVSSVCRSKCKPGTSLTFWRRNFFFLILAHPVYKM